MRVSVFVLWWDDDDDDDDDDDNDDDDDDDDDGDADGDADDENDDIQIFMVTHTKITLNYFLLLLKQRADTIYKACKYRQFKICYPQLLLLKMLAKLENISGNDRFKSNRPSSTSYRRELNKLLKCP